MALNSLIFKSPSKIIFKRDLQLYTLKFTYHKYLLNNRNQGQVLFVVCSSSQQSVIKHSISDIIEPKKNKIKELSIIKGG